MTAYSQAAKRRAKKRRMEAMFGLPKVERPKARGKKRQNQIEKAAQAEPLAVRARKAGLPNTPAGREQAKYEWHECEAGRALFIGCHHDEGKTRRLWKVVTDWRKHEARFLAHVLSARMYPGKDSVPHIPEPVETRDDMEIDLRDDEEKAADAKRAWQVFCEETRLLTEAQLRVCFRGVWDRDPQFIRDEFNVPVRLTHEGAVFVAAIKRLADHLGA